MEQDWKKQREGIIGLGITSGRRSFYPELQRHHAELERFRTLLDSSSEAIILIKPHDGSLLDCNETACRMAGAVREELLTLSIHSFISNEAWGELQKIHCMAAGEHHTLRTDFAPSSGEAIPVEVTCSGAQFQGELLGVLVIRDITERLKLEAQIFQQQKLEGVGLLAGGIAHDFNNMLAPIFVYSEMIRNRFPKDDLNHKQASIILESAGKAKELIKQLLSFSRKQTLSMQRLDLNEIIASFTEILQRTIRENIVIHTSLNDAGCPVMADRTQVEQVLLNLAVNAQDAISGNGTITIESGHVLLDHEYCQLHPGTRPGSYIVLTVGDSGSGMNDETLAHIFEPFFSTKAVGHGTGLGLATVYGIVRQHDGCIDVQSKPGAGTTFRIYLPVAGAEADGELIAGLPEAAAPSRRPATILLVEDNEMVMDMTRELLESYGYTVLPAWLPEDALALARRQEGGIDLLLSDVVMPQMNGPELFQRLRDFLPALKVIYMSGYTNNMVVHNGTLEEEASFISKPFTSATLLDQVSRMLQQDTHS
jgi:PAS domain S-box-containing protein